MERIQRLAQTPGVEPVPDRRLEEAEAAGPLVSEDATDGDLYPA